ncbi:MAG TPA: SpoIIE family protein phosphatase [bacterium]|nr:SpoIIE family protein phosphatase [bacterium]
MTPPRVLVVDDDAALLEALPETIRLRMPGTAVEICASAAPALEQIAAVDYDAIVSDIKMPGMDGLTLLSRVRGLRPDTPVLLITGHGEHDLAIRSLRAGAYDYVQKPIDREYFIASLGRAVQVRQLRRQISDQQHALSRHAGRLEETVQERTTELRQTVEQLRALTDVAAAIHGARGVDEVLKSVVDAACRLSGASLATAGFYRGDDQAAMLADPGRWATAIAPESVGLRIPREDVVGIFAAICGIEHGPVDLPAATFAPLARAAANGDGPWSSFFALPVRGRLGQPLGAMVLARPAGRVFTAEVRVQIEAVALQVAVALENTLLYERARGTAETLQRSLLPERLPDIPGVVLSARYLPGNHEAVGGDWYDVLTLPNGHIGLVIGDVAGRGVWAAAVMGQLRNALRAYALEGNPPALIAERLTRLVDDRTMATLVYLMVDPETRAIRYLNLGHLPPLIVGPEGVTRLTAGAPPLGVRGIAYREDTATLAPSSTIMVYTDGLLEVRGQSIDEGFARVTEVLRRCGDAPVDDLVDRVLASALAGRTSEDDVALVALRLSPLSPERLDIRLPAVPASLAQMRQTLRRWLKSADVAPEEAYDVMTAINEACANAIEHAYGPTDGLFECEVALAHGMLTATVRDIGRWRTARGQYRGHGLKLMEALMGEVQVVQGSTGTAVQMRKRIAHAAGGASLALGPRREPRMPAGPEAAGGAAPDGGRVHV